MKKIITLFLLSFVTLLQAQVGINTAVPDKSAILDVTATNKGFLPPRLEQNDVDTMVEPATGLVIYNITEQCIQVNIGTPTAVNWQCLNGDGSATSGGGVTVANGVCTIEQVAQDTYTDVVDLPPSPTTTRVWMDRNLGADGPYVQGDDTTYGYYYQWGRGADGHELLTSGHTNVTAISHIPGHGDLVIEGPWTLVGGHCFEALYRDGNDPCPDGYRIPTEAEVTAEFASLTTSAARDNHWKNVLKLPPASRRGRSGSGSVTTGRGDTSSPNSFRITITEPTTKDVFAAASDGELIAQPSHYANLKPGGVIFFGDSNDNADANAVRCIKEL